MGFFAAGNDIVTIILALIPVAVFVLSNLYKAFAKVNPAQTNGVPVSQPKVRKSTPSARVMDLEAFLRESKKQGPGKPGAKKEPVKATPEPQKTKQNYSDPNITAFPPVLADRTRPQRVPAPPTLPKQLPNTTNRNQKAQKKQNQANQVNQPFPTIASTGALVMNLGPKPVTPSIEENPVGIALALLRKPNGGAGAFVLQEILGQPRSRKPHRPV